MNKKALPIAAVLLTIGLGVGSSVARDREKATSVTAPLITALTNCRKIADNMQRLGCYDRAVADLDSAITANDLYVVDKASVRKTRSSLFGLQLPDLGLFDKDAGDKNAVSQLEGVVASASQNAYGDWRVTLVGGAMWLQTDELPLGTAIRPGDKVIIKRAMMGSYKMIVGGRPAFRAKRVS